MRLKNKKTGEIAEPFGITCINGRTFVQFDDGKGTFKFEAHSLAELNAEWEDYEEPKGNWTIDPMNEDYIDDGKYTAPDELERYEELGLKFNTKEEAEKAVEKLKAWKRLKDNGFKLKGWKFTPDMKQIEGNYVKIEAEVPQILINEKDIDLLFGGEE